jgi:pyruvate/2-oxoglutarate dehydrogenase complex dihydrolipoamide acyltransferase (E2) component
MKRTTATATVRTVTATDSVDEGAVEALRSRLAGPTAREHVVLDFLADDLKEVRTALAAVAAYVANVEAALSDGEPSQARILSLALGGRPGDRIDELATAVASVRRRLAQVAARM